MNGNSTQVNSEGLTAAEGAADRFLFAAQGEGESIRDRVQAAMFEDGLSQEAVAREADMSPTTLSLYLRDKYTGSIPTVEAKLTKWLDSRGERQGISAVVPDEPAFYASQTARELLTALTYAQALGDMALVIGVPGVGKSTTCREYQRKYSNVWIATMAAHTTGVVPALREIANAVGTSHGTGASGLAREIEKKIRGRNGLLIVDEAHHLSVQALDAIRALHDATGAAVALVGSPELAAKLERMPQLYSRLGVRMYRRKVLKGDVTALLDAWQISGREERRYLTRLADQPGALRSVTKVLRLATALAAGAGQPLALQHIKDAAATLSARITEEADHA